MEQIYYEIEGSITCIKQYCKEHNLFQGKPKSLNLLENVFERILNHHYSIDPEFNEDPQDMINY